MKKPQTIQDFKNLINNMEHRERLLFQTNEGLMLEIYFTIVSDFKDMFNPKFNDNLNVKIYKDYNGKTEKIAFNKSSYLRLLRNETIQTYFDMIKENAIRIDAQKMINQRKKVKSFNY